VAPEGPVHGREAIAKFWVDVFQKVRFNNHLLTLDQYSPHMIGTSSDEMWATEGRLAQILDNLLAQGKAVPMIVVVPEAHALPFETTPITKPYFWANFYPFFVKNQAAVDEELFHDIIPFIQTRYNISNDPRGRAIAGLSMGGLRAMETGIAHLGYFLG